MQLSTVFGKIFTLIPPELRSSNELLDNFAGFSALELEDLFSRELEDFFSRELEDFFSRELDEASFSLLEKYSFSETVCILNEESSISTCSTELDEVNASTDEETSATGSTETLLLLSPSHAATKKTKKTGTQNPKRFINPP
jgi:hypothetical protein